MEYGVDISVIVKNEEHFKYWLGALPFYDNVEKEGVVIDVKQKATSHANLVSKAHSVAGCRPIKNKTPTASYVSKLPTKQREFYFLHGLQLSRKKLIDVDLWLVVQWIGDELGLFFMPKF